MQRLSDSAFAALLAQAGVSQAAFARLTGVTPRQVNKWCRGQAAVPVWAGLIAALLQDHSADAMIISLEVAVMAFKERASGPRVSAPVRRLPCPALPIGATTVGCQPSSVVAGAPAHWTAEGSAARYGGWSAKASSKDNLLDRARPQKADDRLIRLVAGIKAAAPDRTLQQIGTQLEAMRERTPRGGTRWHPSSVKHLLDQAGRLGLIRPAAG